MSEWAVTDPRADRIYGTVEATNELEAAGAADLGQAAWFWRSRPGPHDQLAVHAAGTLTERWRELGIGEPLPGGYCGGDGQMSDSWSRRFGRVRKDGTWAVLTYAWYVQDLRYAQTGEHGEPFVERQIEYMIASEVQDLGSTEIWCDYRYGPPDNGRVYPATEQGVKQAATDFDSAQINWNGEEFR